MINKRSRTAGKLTMGTISQATSNSLKPPGRPAHAFTHDSVDAMQTYQPPAAKDAGKSSTFVYNKDRQPRQVKRPDDTTIDLDYDKVGHLDKVTFPGGQVGNGWDAKKNSSIH